MAQQKLVHARESFQHHSDDQVDLLEQTFWIQRGGSYQKGIPGRVGISGRREYDSGKDKSCLTA